MNSHQARDQAAALFKKKEEQPQESRKATEYEADRHAMREKTARLRTLRLARDQSGAHLARKETLCGG